VHLRIVLFCLKSLLFAGGCHPGPVSDDLPRPRRPLFFPVVIATVFLSIIGMSAGLVLGSRHEDTPQAGPTITTVTPATASTSRTTTAPAGSACRAETQDASQLVGGTGTLTRVLVLRTRTSVVYICRDEAGSLYYHANNGGNTWIENQTALFLPNVRQDGDEYRVTAADGATFSVTRKRLFIVHADGSEEVQPAAD
jgi:hypothetical protein